MVVELLTENVAALPPIVTAVAPVKLAPVIVTLVPPAAGPLVGEILLTVGTATYVNRPLPVTLPPAVVTTTSLAPAVPAGVVAVIVVELLTENVATLPPMVTAVAPVKLVPVIVTLVPPESEPLVGEILLTIGAAI